jgi:hypothetical protein
MPRLNTYFVTEINLLQEVKKKVSYLRAVETTFGTPSIVCLTYLERRKNITLVFTRTFGQEHQLLHNTGANKITVRQK